MPDLTPTNEALRERDVNTILNQAKSQKDVKGSVKTEAASSNAGKKRKSEDAKDASIDPDDVDLSEMEIEWNANQVRGKIRTYINSGEMKVGEFQKKLNVSAASYRGFMNGSGPTKGMQSDTFINASFFFKKRELAGVKMPRAKKAKISDGVTTKKATAADKEKEDKKYDVSGVTLDGEDKLAVPIYDTCDDLRTKINRLMRENAGSTNAGFVRMINAAAFPADATKPTIATPAQLSTFLKGSGPVKGASSPVFYAAYVFFEKLRVRDGKPKTKKREEMEQAWKRTGMAREDFTNKHFFAGPDERPYIDTYGRFQIGSRGSYR